MSIAVKVIGGPLNGLTHRSDSPDEQEAKFARTVFHTTDCGTVGRVCDWRSYYALSREDLPEMMVPTYAHIVESREEIGGDVVVLVRYLPTDKAGQ